MWHVMRPQLVRGLRHDRRRQLVLDGEFPAEVGPVGTLRDRISYTSLTRQQLRELSHHAHKERLFLDFPVVYCHH